MYSQAIHLPILIHFRDYFNPTLVCVAESSLRGKGLRASAYTDVARAYTSSLTEVIVNAIIYLLHATSPYRGSIVLVQ